MILLFPRWDMWSFPGVYFIPLTHLKTISRIEYPKWRTYIYQGASFSRWWQLKYFFIFHPNPWGDDQIWGACFWDALKPPNPSIFGGAKPVSEKHFYPRTPAARLWLVPWQPRRIRKARRWWKNRWRKMQQKMVKFRGNGPFIWNIWNIWVLNIGMEYFEYLVWNISNLVWNVWSITSLYRLVHWTDPKKWTKGV